MSGIGYFRISKIPVAPNPRFLAIFGVEIHEHNDRIMYLGLSWPVRYIGVFVLDLCYYYFFYRTPKLIIG